MEKSILSGILCFWLVIFGCNGLEYHVQHHLTELDYEPDLYEEYDVTEEAEPHSPDSLLVVDNQSTDQINGHDEKQDNVLSPSAQSLQDFSFDIFNALNNRQENGKNAVVSPLSIYVVLATLKPGLGGNSLSEMSKVMNFDSINETDIGQMLTVLFKKNPKYLLRYASRVYVDRSIKLTQSYKNDVESLEVVQVRGTDFRRNPEKSRNKMNKYVRNRTKRLIDELIPEEAVSSNTRLYLVDGLYLKAKWNYRFLKAMTKKQPFQLNAEESILVPIMHAQQTVCSFHQDKELQASTTVLTLGDGLSMVVVMPQHPGNFTGLFDDERTSMKAKFSKLFNKIWLADDDGERILDVCSVALPRFKISYEADLIPNLKSLGLNDIFDETIADFSPMMKGNSENLYIGDVRHKAVFEANEKGVEAAGASSVDFQMKLSGSGIRIKIDKPFIFAVRHDETGAILFLGKVMRP